MADNLNNEHFNELLPDEAERLAILLEEMGEAQQVIGKILRHGYASYHPNNQTQNNAQLLEKELGDVLAAIHMMKVSEDLDYSSIVVAKEMKLSKVFQFTHHQDKCRKDIMGGAE